MGFCWPTGVRVFVLGLLAQVGISACGTSLNAGDASLDALDASSDVGEASQDVADAALDAWDASILTMDASPDSADGRRPGGSCRLDTEATRIMEGTEGVVDCGTVEVGVPRAPVEAWVSCMRTALDAMRPVRGEAGSYGIDSPYRNIYVARTLNGVYRWTQIGAEGDGPTFLGVYTYQSSGPLNLRAYEDLPGRWRVRNDSYGNAIPGPLPPDGPYAPPQLVPNGQICPPPS